jgi:hypothetical protein
MASDLQDRLPGDVPYVEINHMAKMIPLIFSIPTAKLIVRIKAKKGTSPSEVCVCFGINYLRRGARHTRCVLF